MSPVNAPVIWDYRTKFFCQVKLYKIGIKKKIRRFNNILEVKLKICTRPGGNMKLKPFPADGV